jgi:hypothetical protein
VSSQFKPRPLVINARVPHSCRSLIEALGGIESRILATSFVVAVAFFDLAPTEGAATTEISGFWADYGQSAPYCLFAPTGVAIPPRTAGFGNRDRFELNGKIGLLRRQDNSASGMLPVAAMVANIDFPICT